MANQGILKNCCRKLTNTVKSVVSFAVMLPKKLDFFLDPNDFHEKNAFSEEYEFIEGKKGNPKEQEDFDNIHATGTTYRVDYVPSDQQTATILNLAVANNLNMNTWFELSQQKRDQNKQWTSYSKYGRNKSFVSLIIGLNEHTSNDLETLGPYRIDKNSFGVTSKTPFSVVITRQNCNTGPDAHKKTGGFFCHVPGGIQPISTAIEAERRLRELYDNSDLPGQKIPFDITCQSMKKPFFQTPEYKQMMAIKSRNAMTNWNNKQKLSIIKLECSNRSHFTKIIETILPDGKLRLSCGFTLFYEKNVTLAQQQQSLFQEQHKNTTYPQVILKIQSDFVPNAWTTSPYIWSDITGIVGARVMRKKEIKSKRKSLQDLTHVLVTLASEQYTEKMINFLNNMQEGTFMGFNKTEIVGYYTQEEFNDNLSEYSTASSFFMGDTSDQTEAKYEEILQNGLYSILIAEAEYEILNHWKDIVSGIKAEKFCASVFNSEQIQILQKHLQSARALALADTDTQHSASAEDRPPLLTQSGVSATPPPDWSTTTIEEKIQHTNRELSELRQTVHEALVDLKLDLKSIVHGMNTLVNHINIMEQNNQAEKTKQQANEHPNKRAISTETEELRVDRVLPVNLTTNRFYGLIEQTNSQLTPMSELESTIPNTALAYTQGATPTLGQQSQDKNMNDG